MKSQGLGCTMEVLWAFTRVRWQSLFERGFVYFDWRFIAYS